jgi:hypothetical protein
MRCAHASIAVRIPEPPDEEDRVNEQNPHVSNATPPPSALRPPSIWPGFWIAWGALIGGYTVIVSLLGAFASLFRGGGVPDEVWIFIGISPWLLIVGLIVWFGATGRPQMAKGVAIGLASIFGIGLLLFAACFGILSSTNFH